MLKFILYFCLFLSVLNAEKSAFETDIIDSDNPYGLSESEKIIFENKKQIRYQDQKISQLEQKLDGMRSVVESISMKLGKTGARINDLNSKSIEASDNEFEMIKNDIKELKLTQKQNYESVNNVLKKLSTMIDEINNSYVNKSEIKRKSVKKKKIIDKKLTNSQKLDEAINLYRKNHYTKSFPIFEEMAKKSFKPAKSNYYLGEISYYKKRYSDAIVYYKKSAGYYDKASYMPVLFLHTGISFEKLNDQENKRKFLEALLGTYPKSPEAKIAKKYL